MDVRNNYSADCESMTALIKTMITGILFLSGVGILLYYSGNIPLKFKPYWNVVFSTGFTISVLVLIAARIIHSKRLDALKETSLVGKQKLRRFRSLIITHMAVCQFVALSGIICFMIFGNFIFFVMVGLAFAEMMAKYPTIGKIDAVINSRAV